MKATIEVTLSALARIDSGSLTITLDEAIYPEPLVRAFVAACGAHCSAVVQQVGGVLRLQLVATDPKAARLQIGSALTELMQHALRARP